MEDRGVSPRGQAVDGDRGLPVPGFSHPAQPHSVRITGVESSEGSGLPNRADHLPDQARLAARLPRPTTQESHGSNGSCVSPISIADALGPYNGSVSKDAKSLLALTLACAFAAALFGFG